MEIHDVGMTREHFASGDTARIRMVVLHATAGHHPGDYNWLRQGGSTSAPVSIHYYIDKAGTISRMVDDANIAWHAGQSTWVVDGEQIDYASGCNPVSLGIELENLNDGNDPYPQAQYDAALWLVRHLVATYNIPRGQLVRHLDIAPQRKTDPRAFPWEQFVAEVYAAEEAAPPAEEAAEAAAPPDTPESTATPKPTAPATPAPLPPKQQLRALLVDMAYRAAGTSCPQGWALLQQSISEESGMPVLAITPTAGHETPPDGQARAVALTDEQPLVLEAYGRDLFYAPPDTPDQVRRLDTTPPGALRDALLQALFSAVDPLHGFRPGWAFHQYYLEHADDIGVPIAPSYRLPITLSDGSAYVCQHFALDTLCAPVDDWKRITRLSSLTHAMYDNDAAYYDDSERELRTILLNDLYQRRTGRLFDAEALFCHYAIAHQIGAPLARAEYLTLEGQHIVAMPFALDVLYCRVPDNNDWEHVTVGALPDMLGATEEPAPAESDEPATPEHDTYVARLSDLLRQPDDASANELLPELLGIAPPTPALSLPVYGGALLGSSVVAPLYLDISVQSDPGIARQAAAPDLIIVYPTDDSHELLSNGDGDMPRWHYHIDRHGVITRMVHEQHITRAAQGFTWHGENHLDERSLAIAIEGGSPQLYPAQRAALAWLLGDVMQRLHLTPDQILTPNRF
jgi:N-acetyl-anhydromuramyl-L-alanine amidase AmpD